jgi:hypothetical protein
MEATDLEAELEEQHEEILDLHTKIEELRAENQTAQQRIKELEGGAPPAPLVVRHYSFLPLFPYLCLRLCLSVSLPLSVSFITGPSRANCYRAG